MSNIGECGRDHAEMGPILMWCQDLRGDKLVAGAS